MRLPVPGELFEGKYRLGTVLGEGGFATVYSAQDHAHRPVAVKVLKPDGDTYSLETMSRFGREVAVLAQLRSPHTVRLFDSGRTSDGLLFMVFELVPGRDLDDVLREHGRLPPPIAVHIVRQILASLQEAHGAGLLHRDIKPQNVRIAPRQDDPWAVKVLDFGIARPTTGAAKITLTGELVGTPRYMSPEQLTDRHLTEASDLYTVGLLAIELLAGGSVLPGNAWGEQLQRLTERFAFPIPHTLPLNPRLVQWAQRMAARDVGQRFASARDALAALDAISVGAPHPGAAPPRTVTLDERRPQGARYAMVALVACVLITAAVVAIVAFTPPVRPPPAVANVPAVVDDSSAGRAALRVSIDVGVPADARTAFVAPSCSGAPPFVGLGYVRDDYSGDRWLTYVPTGYDPDVEHPLVFLFHQDNQTPEAVFRESGFQTAADAHDFIVVMPESPQEGPLDMFPWRFGRHVANMHVVMEGVADALCVDPQRIFAIGHGSGGIAAEHMSCKPWVAAVAAVSYRSGQTTFLCEPARAVPSLVLEATKSKRMPASGGEACGVGITKISIAEARQMWFARNGCHEQSRATYASDAGVCRQFDCDVPFWSCDTHGGHGWPGGTERLIDHDPIRCDGPPAKFDASRVIGEFFASLEPRE